MMPCIREHYDLTGLTTFGLRSEALRYAEASTVEDLRELWSKAAHEGWTVRILGGGANIVAGPQVDGLVVRMRFKGVSAEPHPNGGMLLIAEAGEVLDDLVRRTLAEGWAGMEGLAAVPGTLGGAVVQNAGAYGTEIAELVEWVEAWDPQADQVRRLSIEDCDFGYRHSLFKTPAGAHLVILRAALRVGKPDAQTRPGYKDLTQELERSGADPCDPRAIETAVRALRARKLPDPARVGNAGSFFKNPIVTQVKARILRTDHPMLVVYPLPGGRVKLAAGWLIQEAGFKGVEHGPVAMSEQHALVMVNRGGATAEDVKSLRDAIIQAVDARFGVQLEPEAVFWD